MKTLATLIAIVGAGGAALAQTTSLEEKRHQAIQAVIASAETHLVRLRYFGDNGDALGASAAPITGWKLNDQWVLTSDYGLSQAPAAIVGRSFDSEPSRYTLVSQDHNRRLTLLRVESDRPVGPPSFRSDRPACVGETAIALGAVDRTDAASVSVGVVSAVARHGGRSIQTDAAISPRNYGGPLLGLDGALLGVITPLAAEGMSGVELYDSGIGFAVPPAEFGPRLERLAGGESIRAGWLGASFAKNDPLRSPPRITAVVAEGPAAAAELARGDAMLSVAGTPTPSVWRLRSVLGGLDAGQRVATEIQRADGKRGSVSIRLGKRPPKAPEPKIKQEEPDEP